MVNSRELAVTSALWTLRVVLAVVFLAAAAPKLADPRAFADAVRSFELLPDPWNATFAAFLPFLELFVAIGLLIPWLTLGAGILSMALFAGFVGALASARARGLEIDCGCFGSRMVTPDYYREAISLRVALFLMAAGAFWLGWRKAFRRQK